VVGVVGRREHARRDVRGMTRTVPWAVDVLVRRATADDARAIAAVHVHAWRWAYRGLLPSSLLARMSEAPREAAWRETIVADGAKRTSVWVAELSGRMVGFVATGAPQHRGYAEDTAEVYSIYQLQEAAKTGVARRMLSRALDDLRARGFGCAILWVLETNGRARDFYEREGWCFDGGARTDALGRFVLHEVRYHLDLASGPSTSAPGA
jgi:ribosomal protein S18 acetylase RimI-like enzyme